ncbi:large ribosomal subunit protein bL21c [Humulus lupulus]|uniref:large ribosomal subunit protein bL21c n=1 Tax=Humulus lupulus TaxID=3486 RepID=UPI002B40762F|nr:large ribosomal subunit protein bL21c [Humulus lupulus]
MASATTLSLCSSLTAQCKISHKWRTHHLPLSNPNLTFLSLSSPNLSLSSATPSHRIHSPLPPKASQSEAPVLEATELDAPNPEDAKIVEVSSEEPQVAASEEPAPKREEIFAVVMIGSRQYIVFPGRWIKTQRLKGANVDDKIVLKKVLLVGTKTSTYIGKPVVTNAAVHAVVEEQALDRKVIVFKYKKKKNYRRNIGHRQPITRIRITGITGYQDYPAVTLDS